MNFLYALITVLSSLFGFTLRYYPFRNVIDANARKKLFAIYAGLSLVHLAVLAVIYGKISITLELVQLDGMVFTAILLLVFLVMIPGRWREHTFVCGVVVTCSYLVMTLPIYLSAVFTDDEVTIWTMGLFCLLQLAVYFPLRKLLDTTVAPFLYLDSGNYWSTVWFIPVAMFLAMYFICPGGAHKDTINHLISHGLIAMATITMCWSIAADHQRLKETLTLTEQLNLQKNHYTQLEARVADARKMSHDFKHHIAAIQRFIDADDREGLQAYCWELGERPISGVRIPYTGNSAVDGVMYRYAQLAAERDVEFSYFGSIQNCAMDSIDLAVLLGNALDNALAGCMTVDRNRNIKVVMQSESHLISVLVHNSFDGVVQKKDDVYYSRKRDNAPGIGMSSMHSICEKYEAGMDVRWDDENFTVLFMIPVKLQ